MTVDLYHLGNKIPHIFFSIILIFLFTTSSFAQTGSITGHVQDKETKSALPGANVIVDGTSFGAATDLDGNYIIRSIPVGKYKITVSYIGYTSTSAEVEVPEGRALQQNFSLEVKSVESKTVVVTAQAQGQMQAINQQLSSDKISNVVSEAKIQELPDFNAAASIGRLPGVSTLESSGEANKVVIRGLAPKYNKITIGGVSLASTGSDQIGIASQSGTAGNISNDRSVDLTMVSSYMLKNITVYKSLTPDMNADAIGGVVDLELREAPPEFHTDLTWQSGYTAKSKKYGNYRAVGSVSNRFFNDQLGVYLLGNIESYDRNADNMNASYEITNSQNITANGYLPVRVTSVTLQRHIETRKRYGGNLILDYRLPHGSIKLINMASRLTSDVNDYNTQLGYKSNNLTFAYSGGENKIDVAVNTLEIKNDFNFMQFHFTASNNYSRNYLPASPRFRFNQTRGVTSSPDTTIPEDLTYLVNYGGPTSAYLDYLGLYSSDYKENDQSYKTSFKFPLNVGQVLSGYFKFGGEYSYRQHKNEQYTPYATIAGTDTVQTRIKNALVAQFPELNNAYNTANSRFNSSAFGNLYNNSFLDNRFGKVFWSPNTGLMKGAINLIASDPYFSSYNSTAAQPGGWFDGPFQKLANTYKYIERYYAGYGMSELNYGDLMIVGGVRYEKEKGLYEAYNIKDGRNSATDVAYLVNSYPQNEFWLPMVQGKYKVTDWLDMRASYTQTLARPDYHQLSPHYTISYDKSTVVAGNANLRPAQAYNYDLGFTFHTNELGLFSIVGFYKEVKDFTYSTQYALLDSLQPPGFYSASDFNIGGVVPLPHGSAKVYTYINSPYLAFIKGVEVDFQTRFWYLPVPFNGIIFSINYTHIWSKATYPWLDKRSDYSVRPARTFIVDSTRTGRLIHQPDDVLNATLGYEFSGFSARLSFLFTGNAVSYVGNFGELDGFTRDYFRMDFSARQTLPWQGLEVFLDMSNLNNRNNQSAQESIGGFTNIQNYGLTANLGVRYRL